MRAVETRRHEEGRAIDVAFEGEGRVDIFIGLHEAEQRAERDRQPEPPFDALAVVLQQRVVRPGHGGARGQQDQRVEEGKVPGVEHLDSLRRPVSAGERGARHLMNLVRKQRGVEEGPEPRDEEHHLRGDEHHHAVAVMELHDLRVVAAVRLPDDVGPPGSHDVQHADDADAEHQRGDVQAARGHVLHPHHRADRHDQRARGADDRPRARIDEMIVVMLGVGVCHRSGSSNVGCVARRAPSSS